MKGKLDSLIDELNTRYYNDSVDFQLLQVMKCLVEEQQVSEQLSSRF